MKRSTRNFRAGAWIIATCITSSPSWSQEVHFPAAYFGRTDMPLPESIVHLEKVIGDTNNFEPVDQFSEGNRYRVLSNPVGRLDLMVEDKGETSVATCTAWMVAPDIAMTNYHCVPGFSGRVQKAILLMGYLRENSDAGTKAFEVNVQPLESNDKLDYALLRTSGVPGKEFGVISLAIRPAQENEEIFIIQHPAGRPKKLARRNCRITAAENKDKQLMHICDTLGGSSGSPVFSDNDYSVIGLHNAGIEKKVNFAVSLRAIAEQSAVLKPLIATSGAVSGNATAMAAKGGNISKPAVAKEADDPPTKKPEAKNPLDLIQ